jgi:hypothetical protein
MTVIALGALAGGIFGYAHSGSTSTGPRHRAGVQHGRLRRAFQSPHISPALEGGSYGWCVTLADGGSCATVPTKNVRTLSGVRSIGTLADTNVTPREERVTALLAAGVEGVLANGRPARVVTLARLPYGLRLTQIELPRPTPPAPKGRTHGARSIGPPPRPGFRTPPAPPPPTEAGRVLLATGIGGKPLAYVESETGGGLAGGIHWWERPHPLAPGPCQIRAHGLPALQPQWGHVASSIRPYRAQIIGRAFFSCIDTEYYLHNWPIETAILLDAEHPGRAPAAIPGMRAIRGTPGLFDAPGDWHGEITALRHGNAWLVVAGGSGLYQRLQVIRHLSASVSS